MFKKDAMIIVGGISNPSKMPGKGYGISPTHCKTGAKLRKVEGSICSTCYAMKKLYCMKVVKKAHQNRLDSLGHPSWVPAITTLIGNDKYFRWHDSGDLQSLQHLESIVEVCEATPNTKHWLPSKEKRILKQYLKKHIMFPANLSVRLSSAMIDAPPMVLQGVNTSTVHKNKPAHGLACPAYTSKNKSCVSANCFACWDRTVKNISYSSH